jgi:hypothetical protein
MTQIARPSMMLAGGVGKAPSVQVTNSTALTKRRPDSASRTVKGVAGGSGMVVAAAQSPEDAMREPRPRTTEKHNAQQQEEEEEMTGPTVMMTGPTAMRAPSTQTGIGGVRATPQTGIGGSGAGSLLAPFHEGDEQQHRRLSRVIEITTAPATISPAGREAVGSVSMATPVPPDMATEAPPGMAVARGALP